jgi:hypothetical protein
MEHPPYSSDLAPKVFWLFPKIKPTLDEDFRILNTSKKNDGAQSYSVTGLST